MRQIDADALLKDINDYPYGYRGMVKDTIAKQPTIEPKNGRWIIRDISGTYFYQIICSECGEDVTSSAPCIGFLPDARVLWDYCPHCGAKMNYVANKPAETIAIDERREDGKIH
ncbi:MAG: hypothetical protein IIY21_22845 [Clostridiales bacterium]|nr:hypothetical protein [Clostridiales bacterium]